MKVTPYQKQHRMYTLGEIGAKNTAVWYTNNGNFAVLFFDKNKKGVDLPIHYVFWSHGKQVECVGEEPYLSNLILEYAVFKGKHILIQSSQKISALRKKYGEKLSRDTLGYDIF